MSNVTASIALQARSISKSYHLGGQEIRVLNELNGPFAQGETTMIQGASGCGKSTLLQILGGLDTPTSGEVLYQGQSIYAWSKAKLAHWRNEHIGFIFQSYHLLPDLSALENVDLPAMLARRGSPAKAKELLDRVGLSHRLHHRPAELSGGEQQRVAIARALRNNPEILLADEPTGNLDSTTGQEISELLFRLQREEKKTLIVVTHDDTMASCGQHLYRLAQGRFIS